MLSIQLNKLGFNVEKASANSKNAFIWFETGPYIELIEMNNVLIPFAYIFRWLYGKAMKERWKKWCGKKEGFVDFAIEPIIEHLKSINRFTQNQEILRNFGIHSSKVITWSRKNLNDEKIYFSYLPILPVSLPFVVSDYSVVQRPKCILHKNNLVKVEKVNFICKGPEYTKLKKILSNDSSIQLVVGSVSKVDQVILKNKNGELYQLTNQMTIEKK
ncbi:hypothetical protein V2J64_11470 [Staphylococcus saccharolyticus]|uniref:hypothetical protein n=1 Tax=Staphylococcus saccharolyticus TaxID=33028 RepID=UPI0032DFB565